MSTQDSLKALHKAKVAKDKADADYATAELAYIEDLLDAGMTTDTVGITATVKRKGTLVPSNTTRRDVAKAEELLSGPLFRSVTKRVIDTDAYKAAIKLGKISAESDALISTTTPNDKPYYIKLS